MHSLPQIEVDIAVEQDPKRPKSFCVTIRDEEGNLLGFAGENLELLAANRALMPARAAFMAGAKWMRDNFTSYLLSVTPHVICTVAQKDEP